MRGPHVIDGALQVDDEDEFTESFGKRFERGR